jgi:hypothetical protein
MAIHFYYLFSPKHLSEVQLMNFFLANLLTIFTSDYFTEEMKNIEQTRQILVQNLY